jgi:hypothetical protein
MRSFVIWALVRAVVCVALDVAVLHDPTTWIGAWAAFTLIHATAYLDRRDHDPFDRRP